MEKKMPISFEGAVRIAERQYAKSDIFTERDQMKKCTQQFIEFISEQGFHIALTGDEFELPFQSKSTN